MKKTVTAAIYLDTRREKSGGYYPVKLRITYQRERKYFPLTKTAVNGMLTKLQEFTYTGSGDYSIDEDSFNKATTAKPRGKYAELAKVFKQIVTDADDIIKEMEHFSFDLFGEIYSQKNYNDGNDVFTATENYIRKLNDENRIGTAISYQTSLNSLKRFHQKSNLPFDAITVDFLKRYETWMIDDEGNGLTTVGIYLRQLRSIFNQKPEQLKNIPYPFGRGKYEIPSPQGRKMALSGNSLQRMFIYQPENEKEQYFLDVWKLLYLLSGINVADISRLKYGNISHGFIYFQRQKTSKTNRSGSEIKISINDDIREIFERWGNKPINPEQYILPVLNDDLNQLQQKKAVQQFTKQINKYVGRISERLEIPIKVTTYFARHSFATQLMRHGAPTEFISKQLGHSSLNTTRSYLHSFEDKQLQEWQSKLTDF